MHLRDPVSEPAPADIEPRRLQIYRDLIYRNIESFIRKGFPVLHTLMGDQHWNVLIRQFIVEHRCESPYFRDIAGEFLSFIEHCPAAVDGQPEFVPELAHYEWVELALDTAGQSIPDNHHDEVTEQSFCQLSPLAWLLRYQYPVHRIRPDFQPTEPPAEPTLLAVYRDRTDRVRFLEINAVTARLIALFDGQGMVVSDAMVSLSMALPDWDRDRLMAFGLPLVCDLVARDILYLPGP
ncbi:MAG: DUF2063 domain-containing protein [Porticoccaceae bacterium]|nr:DUF2063 domain-containing protein [Porticoccaceae bacterium]